MRHIAVHYVLGQQAAAAQVRRRPEEREGGAATESEEINASLKRRHRGRTGKGEEAV